MSLVGMLLPTLGVCERVRFYVGLKPHVPVPYEAVTAVMVDSGGSCLGLLRPRLVDIPSKRLMEPLARTEMLVQEGLRLAELIEDGEHGKALLDVGLSSEQLEDLDPAIEALREAEQAWLAARDADKSQALVSAETCGYHLREELLAACRYHLSARHSGGTLGRIGDGAGRKELVADLTELAELVAGNLSRFERDRSFDAEERIAEAQELVARLSPIADATSILLDVRLLEERDRAFTFLLRLTGRLRAAGRYAFRGTEKARMFYEPEARLGRARRVHEEFPD